MLLTKYGLREIILATLICGGGATAAFLLLPAGWNYGVAALPVVFWLYVLSFFRDPPRRIPGEPNIFVAPADGRITDITELDSAEFLDEPAVRVGIFLSVLDVHVNRAPCAGRVEYVQHKDGGYLDARHADATHRNEANAVGLVCPQWNNCKVLIRQIAGMIARRIVCALKPGDTVAAGQRFGMIKFGSRTELIVPRRLGFVPTVKVGDKVKGGRDVLGRLPG
jgi:phosphatidylserine decarboxylase